MLDLLVGQPAVHERAEHGGAVKARDAVAVVRVADPHGHGELRGDADKPAVLRVLGGAGLARDGLAVGQARAAARAAGDDALHDLDGRAGDLLRDRALALGVGVVDDHVAVAVDHLLDDHRVTARSAVGDGGVGAGHLEGGDLLGAERDRHDGVELGGDAEPVGHLHDVLGAYGRADAHEAGVGGDGERARDAAGAVIRAAVVLDLVAVELKAGRAAHLRVRRNPLLKSGH